MPNDEGGKQIWNVAILAVKKGSIEFGLLSDHVTATSEEDARCKAYETAMRKYPESDGFRDYHVSVSRLFSMKFISDIAVEVVDNAVLSAEIIF